MSRISSLEKNVVKIVSDNTGKRPVAPASLTKDQKTIWTKTVKGFPADFFGLDAFEMLEIYCRNIDSANLIEKMIVEFNGQHSIADIISDKEKIDALSKLQRMAELQQRGAVSIATKLRITAQSTRSSYGVKKAEAAKSKPWD